MRYSLDLYSKIVLTVIAACLVVICLRPMAAPRPAIAFERFSNRPEPAQVDMNLQQIGGQDVLPGQPVPVQVVGPVEVRIVSWPDSMRVRLNDSQVQRLCK